MTELGSIEVTRPEPALCVVRATGEFDLSNVAELRRALDGVAPEHALVVDLDALEFGDSAVLNVLVATARGRSGGSALVIAAAPGSFAANLLKVSGCDRIIERRDTVAQAISLAHG